jgi:hypothetical protein
MIRLLPTSIRYTPLQKHCLQLPLILGVFNPFQHLRVRERRNDIRFLNERNFVFIFKDAAFFDCFFQEGGIYRFDRRRDLICDCVDRRGGKGVDLGSGEDCVDIVEGKRFFSGRRETGPDD